MYISDKRLYLTNDGKVVEGDLIQGSGILLVAEGGTLDDETVKKHRLIIDPEAKTVRGPGDIAEDLDGSGEGALVDSEDGEGVRDLPAGSKALHSAPEDKAVKQPPATKRR